MRKNLFVLLVLALIISFSLTGCGNDKELLGTWYLVRATKGGQFYPVLADPEGKDSQITFNDNGTFDMLHYQVRYKDEAWQPYNKDSFKDNVKYSCSSGKLTTTQRSAKPVEGKYKVENGELTIEGNFAVGQYFQLYHPMAGMLPRTTVVYSRKRPQQK
ncbi:MAG: hypothetical protein GX221_06920 [Candidatus Riflebacteria bacterium]|nr:hypothetical protein [Candidatus Riflebacteria bacterium]